LIIENKCIFRWESYGAIFQNRSKIKHGGLHLSLLSSPIYIFWTFVEAPLALSQYDQNFLVQSFYCLEIAVRLPLRTNF
jgi:hypothetical protein